MEATEHESKRTKHESESDPEGLFGTLDEPTLVHFMCNLSVPNMIKLAKVSKRFRDVYQDEVFIRKCVETSITPHERAQRALHMMKPKIRSIAFGYTMECVGETPEGVVYNIAFVTQPESLGFGLLQQYRAGQTRYIPGKPDKFASQEDEQEWFIEKFKNDRYVCSGHVKLEFPVHILDYQVISAMTQTFAKSTLERFDNKMHTLGVGPEDSKQPTSNAYRISLNVRYAVKPSASIADMKNVWYSKEWNPFSSDKPSGTDTITIIDAYLAEESRAKTLELANLKFIKGVDAFERARVTAIEKFSKTMTKSTEVTVDKTPSGELLKARVSFTIRQIRELAEKVGALLKSMDRSRATVCVRDIRDANAFVARVDNDGLESIELAEAEKVRNMLEGWLEV